ncbi:hypothetical protein BT67DRAFT_257878 [Trichocladium antarcticum]|uniref:Uncharacterized protein n=1 Tax=Trichocladium antarcticum TaxID=1450529 RepID=A0AAN6UMW0_9PEZI|nr:hypothetical protein BT67DRAFT_257878 [Trichocladium antarcticum]
MPRINRLTLLRTAMAVGPGNKTYAPRVFVSPWNNSRTGGWCRGTGYLLSFYIFVVFSCGCLSHALIPCDAWSAIDGAEVRVGKGEGGGGGGGGWFFGLGCLRWSRFIPS